MAHGGVSRSSDTVSLSIFSIISFLSFFVCIVASEKKNKKYLLYIYVMLYRKNRQGIIFAMKKAVLFSIAFFVMNGPAEPVLIFSRLHFSEERPWE